MLEETAQLMAVIAASVVVGFALGIAAYHKGLILTAGDRKTIALGGKQHYLIPTDEVGGELWFENDAMRKAIDRIRDRTMPEVEREEFLEAAKNLPYDESRPLLYLACWEMVKIRETIAELDEAF